MEEDFRDEPKENPDMKTLLLVAALCVFMISSAAAKSYDIVLTSPTVAGNVALKAGEYRLKVEGNTATFTNVENGKTFTAPVKVETSDQKFDQTRLQSTKEGEQDKLQEIDLSGSHTKL